MRAILARRPPARRPSRVESVVGVRSPTKESSTEPMIAQTTAFFMVTRAAHRATVMCFASSSTGMSSSSRSPARSRCSTIQTTFRRIVTVSGMMLVFVVCTTRLLPCGRGRAAGSVVTVRDASRRDYGRYGRGGGVERRVAVRHRAPGRPTAARAVVVSAGTHVRRRRSPARDAGACAARTPAGSCAGGSPSGSRCARSCTRRAVSPTRGSRARPPRPRVPPRGTERWRYARCRRVDTS